MKPNTQITDKEIKETVFRCLCGVLKKHHLYAQFRCMMRAAQRPRPNHNGARLTVALNHAIPSIRRFQNEYGRDNLFTQASCKEDIFDMLDKIDKDGIPPLRGQELSEIGYCQIKITQYINILLHTCVECYVRDYRLMEKIGGETYDMICKSLFGEDFVDETEQIMPQNVKDMISAQQAYMDDKHIHDINQLRNDEEFRNFLVNMMRSDRQRDRGNEFLDQIFADCDDLSY